MSGGEQQMLAMGRALMSNASMLMLDEPSMGLSPLLVQEIFDIIQNVHKEGMTILLVEQNAQMALSVADRAYVLETGRGHGGHRCRTADQRARAQRISGRLSKKSYKKRAVAHATAPFCSICYASRDMIFAVIRPPAVPMT